jgi:BMFP domain-containing protein YqiC
VLFETLRQRIAELEQRHCGGALMEREEHHVGVVNKLLERIAELEARTLTVKLPEYDMLWQRNPGGSYETVEAISVMKIKAC